MAGTTRTRRRAPSPTAQRMKQATADSGKQLFKDWATLTFVTDRQKLLGPITPMLLNWVFVVALVVAAKFTVGHGKILVIAAAAWLVLTALRANHVQNRRRKTINDMFATVAPRAKLPAGTAANPTNPASHIRKIRWGAGARPERFTLKLNSAAPAASAPLLRDEVEADIENIAHAHSKNGGEWMFDWNNSVVTATAVRADDPLLAQKATSRRIIALIKQIFAIKRTGVQGWNVELGQWATDEATGNDYPTVVVVKCAEQDLTDPALRDRVERHFERAVTTPGEWLFSWDTGASTLTAESIDPTSLEAQRKRIQRRLSDDMSGLVSRPGKDPIIAEVTEWIADDQPLPRDLKVTFGTMALDDPRTIDRIEDGFDQAVQNRWPQARALFAWHHGAITELDITLVASDDPEALRRAALTRFRNVTQSKFGSARNAVTTEVLEWQEKLSPNGTALPARARVNFGTVDVTKPETRDAFQDHWDSIDNSNDWSYTWNTPEGFVEMTEVPKLAVALAFPNDGDELHDFFMSMFREGKIVLGPQKGGGWFVWDLNKVPHGLIGGRTGAGKSVQLDDILYLILRNRDIADIVVCDPKMTDFTWTPEFPNVLRFAAGAAEICAAIAWVHAEMERRQTLLNKRGVRNMRYLRKLYEERPEYLAEDGSVVPKRIFLFFDEIANFLGPSANKDLEELKDEARSQLEQIGQLSRAMEINMIVAAQKPEKKYVSTQLKQMMELRVCVGPVDEYTSKQILESTHGTRFGEGTPKGRAWAWTSEQGFRVVQVPYLPSATEPAPWDPSITLEGSRERLRRDLRADGWTQIMVPNEAGGRDPRWVQVEDVSDGAGDDDGQAPPALLPADLPDNAGDRYLTDDGDTEPDDGVTEVPFDPLDEPPF